MAHTKDWNEEEDNFDLTLSQRTEELYRIPNREPDADGIIEAAVLPLRETTGETQTWELVGPVCESGDFLAHARTLALAEGDLLALRDAGAYGFTMSSNYNTRPRPAEVMVDGERVHLIRARETLDDLWRGEILLAD